MSRSLAKFGGPGRCDVVANLREGETGKSAGKKKSRHEGTASAVTRMCGIHQSLNHTDDAGRIQSQLGAGFLPLSWFHTPP